MELQLKPLSSLLLLLLTAAGARAEERWLRVPADRSWTGTGIRVRAGDWIRIRASGDISWGKGDTGPDGTTRASGGLFRPLGSKPLGGLIGQVGTEVFWVGAGAEIEAPADGELALGINDDKVSDNSGEFRVEIRVEPERGRRGEVTGSSLGSSGSDRYRDDDRNRYRDDDWSRYRDERGRLDRDRDRDWLWWRGEVDGVDHLIVRGDTLSVKHLDKQPIQSQDHRFSDTLPDGPVEGLRLDTRQARGRVRLLQHPGRGNDWTAIVLLDDSEERGSDRYELLLSWDRPRRSSGSSHDGMFRWRGQVDIGCRISIRGDAARVQDRGGRGTSQRFADFTAPLPAAEVPVSLRTVRGRGKVRLVEIPSRSNDHTAVVEIEDDKGGSDLYEFELTWRR